MAISSCDTRRYERALNERLYLMEWADTVDHIQFKIMGSRGMPYSILLGNYVCSCTCPDYIRRGDTNPNHKCKHILFVLCKLFGKTLEFVKSSQSNNFKVATVRKWLRTAPVQKLQMLPESLPASVESKVVQCPLSDDPCPVCYEVFLPTDSVLYCKKQCGKNVHQECYRRYLQYQKKQICIMCRTEWQ